MKRIRDVFNTSQKSQNKLEIFDNYPRINLILLQLEAVLRIIIRKGNFKKFKLSLSNRLDKQVRMEIPS